MSSRRTLRERLGPRVMPRREYLGSNFVVSVTLQVVSAGLISGLAISRANGHQLSPLSTALILSVGPAFGALLGALVSFFSSLTDAITGRVTPDGTGAPARAADALSSKQVWGRGILLGAAAAVWGTGVALLVVAGLNGKSAGFAVLFVGDLIASGLSAPMVGLVSGAEGVRVGFGRAKGSAPRPARRRAWRELALPFGIVAAILTAGFSWVLFHDYAIAQPLAEKVLSEKEILGDLNLQALIIVGGGAFILGRAGRAEATLGLVAFEDPEAQIPEKKSLFGVQAYVYAVLATLFIGAPLVRLVIPEYPNLATAMIARGLLAGVLAYIAGGIAYVRGAANTTADPIKVEAPVEVSA